MEYHDNEEIPVESEPSSLPPKFISLLNDANEPLWNGCKKHTTLSAVSQLLNCKSEFNVSESCFNRFMGIMKSMLPEKNELPENYYQMKKKMEGFGLGYVKIHACMRNCMLFYKEDEDLEYCRFCGHARYKPQRSNGKTSKIPFKVLRYFPLTPRLQRLFMSKKIAENMVWHSLHQSPSGVLLHPSDGEAWKQFNSTHESFAAEMRKVRLGLCTDGFSPFKQGGRPYSCWPVMIVVYNLPPWMCMKQPYILLTLVIPGPNSPSQNIDIFLRPLIDELKVLWGVGVRTYDAHKNEHFSLRAALMWTISDFPAYGMLSGWSTHGRLSCPYCMGRSTSFILQHGKKPCFFDCHRQFLPLDHPFRRQRDKFKRGVVHDPPIPRLTGEEVLQEIDSIPNIPFGTKCPPQKPFGYGSISFAIHRERMEKEKQGPVTFLEVFDRTHRRKKGQGDYVDPKSKSVTEAYVASMEEKYGPDHDFHPEFDPEAWCGAIGGMKTTRTRVWLWHHTACKKYF